MAGPENNTPNYAQIAKDIRLTVLEMLYKAQTSHIGSNFSCVDILTVLYENKKEEDEIIISKGWVAATAYALLKKTGLITSKELESYCKEDSKYIGLLEPTVPGIRCAGGSMGYGLPFAVGFAFAKKIKGEKGKVYCLMSDGEQAIGTTWESTLIAEHHNLNNLVVIVDCNGYQAMGNIKDILKWRYPSSFGMKIDGHNYQEIEDEVINHKSVTNPGNPTGPMFYYAKTIKGKGVSFMENDNRWHYLNIDKQSYERAKAELRLT